jgi:putative spermidine/putrescine transport system substrate-binding protein
MEEMMHKHLTIAALAGAILMNPVNGASAEPRTLVVAGVAGPFEQVFRTQVLAAFTAKTGISAEYAGGNAVDQIARMIAQKSSQQIDVFITDDGPMLQAIGAGLCGKIVSIPANDLIDLARYPDDLAVAFGLISGGIAYNTKYFAEHGWAKPTSWNDLKDAKYRGKLVVPPLNTTFGVAALVMLARANGGGEANIDPGFAAMKQVAPNVLAFDMFKITQMFQTGEIVIAASSSPRTKAQADTGFPIDYVYPREGAAASRVSACPIARTDAIPGAQALIGYLLRPEVQLLMAQKLAHMPVNNTVALSDAASRFMPTGENAARLAVLDWQTITNNRAEWDRRWTREVER